MANHKSAEKRARQTERRTAVNGARRSRVRGSIKKVEEEGSPGRPARRAAGDPARRRRARGRSQRRCPSRIATECTHQGDELS